jgi:6-phosphofructokinase 1
MTKTIGVLTSGGDCAGLNMVLKAVTDSAVGGYGWRVLGIKHGTMGLLTSPPDYIELTQQHFDTSMARLGGTILGTTNKGNPFHFPMPDGSFKDRSQEIVNAIRSLNLDAIIGIGGDGSLKILHNLFNPAKIPLVGIPKTIDNDIGSTEKSVGFSTAVDVATEALDRLQPTAASHDRVMILEVMGRDAGHIALSAGIAGGADVIVIPEIPYKFDNIVKKIQTLCKRGRNFALVIVAEAVKTEEGKSLHITDNTGHSRFGGIGHYFADKITELTGAETRFMILGHVQRGAQPSASDRVLASAFGVKAVDLIAQGKFDRMVAWRNRDIIDVPILEALSAYRTVDKNDTLVKTARGLGICLGDQS